LLADYQQIALRNFFGAKPKLDGVILEVGSDLEARVANAIAERTRATVIAVNPHPSFVTDARPSLHKRVQLLCEDGRRLSLSSDSVDAIFTVATLEHVIGLNEFFAEMRRVLKPGGVLFAAFAPIWSSAKGHHVFVVEGSKEARFWKAGKNPIPDFAHLLWTPQEMRAFLQTGPCADNLIDPIVHWIYEGDGINRHFLNDHLKAIAESGLLCEGLIRHNGDFPDISTARQLRQKYGKEHDFAIVGVDVTLRKKRIDVMIPLARLRRAMTEMKHQGNKFRRALGSAGRHYRPIRNYLQTRVRV
jgi:SAM-dependent methyltransferase